MQAYRSGHIRANSLWPERSDLIQVEGKSSLARLACRGVEYSGLNNQIRSIRLYDLNTKVRKIRAYRARHADKKLFTEGKKNV
jgi:hypothetical protein